MQIEQVAKCHRRHGGGAGWTEMGEANRKAETVVISGGQGVERARSPSGVCQRERGRAEGGQSCQVEAVAKCARARPQKNPVGGGGKIPRMRGGPCVGRWQGEVSNRGR